MAENEIDFCLIPLKYKVKQYVDIQTRFLEILPAFKNSKHKNELFGLSEKIKERKLTQADKRKTHVVVNLMELGQLRKDKKEQLGTNYSEEVLNKREWICLINAFADPVYTFQEQFFKFYIHQQTKAIFGEQLAVLIREVLRDGFITEVEKAYICERADEIGFVKEDILEKLKDYESQNLAMCETIYEICKDGVITETEKEYLCQKANEYKVNSSSLVPMIENILDLIDNIHTCFEQDSFYESVQYLFLSQFFRKAGVEFQSTWMQDLFMSVCKDQKNWLLEEEKESFCKIVSTHLKNRFFGIASSLDIKTNFDLLLLLGITPKPKQNLLLNVKKVSRNLIADAKLEEVLKRKASSDFQNIFDNTDQTVFELGGETYEFVTVIDKTKPLFFFDVIGNRTIITINKEHYFHKDTKYFQLLIITFVNNLKKNYASEDLVEEVQHLLNPPAAVRINYQKPIYEIN